MSETKEVLTLSPECSEALAKWLALFVQHYRQEVLDLAVVAYRIGLQDLTFEELNRGCERSLQECEFFPKVSDIRSRGYDKTGRRAQQELAWKASDSYERAVNWAKVNYTPDIPNSAIREELPPTVEYAMKVCGGPKMFLDATQQYWIHKQFVEAYLDIHEKLREEGITTRIEAKAFIGNFSEQKLDFKQLAAGEMKP